MSEQEFTKHFDEFLETIQEYINTLKEEGVAGENRPALPKSMYEVLSDAEPISLDYLRNMRTGKKYRLFSDWQRLNSYNPCEIAAGKHRFRDVSDRDYKTATKKIGEKISKKIQEKSIELASTKSYDEYREKARNFEMELEGIMPEEDFHFISLIGILHKKYFRILDAAEKLSVKISPRKEAYLLEMREESDKIGEIIQIYKKYNMLEELTDLLNRCKTAMKNIGHVENISKKHLSMKVAYEEKEWGRIDLDEVKLYSDFGNGGNYYDNCRSNARKAGIPFNMSKKDDLTKIIEKLEIACQSNTENSSKK